MNYFCIEFTKPEELAGMCLQWIHIDLLLKFLKKWVEYHFICKLPYKISTDNLYFQFKQRTKYNSTMKYNITYNIDILRYTLGSI